MVRTTETIKDLYINSKGRMDQLARLAGKVLKRVG